ncbi:GntR family transcriptional regulator [Lysinimonas soli]|uniref:GntR family transcriptional regulator n=1 Tax=Lysinimonas soli TaxID=1074233 RepID=A0ABW0NT00_9MICO
MSAAASPSPRPDAIQSALRDAILDGSEAPGSTLTESAVALRFGVTRPTAKLALERLVSDGLLRREPYQAARVPELTPDDIRDLFDTRAMVEGAAVSTLARSGAVPPAAVAAQRELRAHPASFAKDDIAFHRALVAGQPSPRLARMHELVMGEVELCIGQVQANHLLDASEVAAQHQQIMDAITRGDPVDAARFTRQHIEGARDVLLGHFATTHGDD